MEEAKQKCWRQEVDVRLKHLHSFLFGAKLALDKDNFHSVYALGHRLLDFLDSHCNFDVDEAFIHPIRSEILAKLHYAHKSRNPDADWYAFEQANRLSGQSKRLLDQSV